MAGFIVVVNSIPNLYGRKFKVHGRIRFVIIPEMSRDLIDSFNVIQRREVNFHSNIFQEFVLRALVRKSLFFFNQVNL